MHLAGDRRRPAARLARRRRPRDPGPGGRAGQCLRGPEAQLREKRRRVDPDLDAIATLAAQHAASAKALAHLLGVLRATPRSRMVPRGAGRQMAQVARVRPWEVSSDG